MFHIADYTSAAVLVGGNFDVPAQADGVLSISNNHFRLVDNMSLVGAYYGSATAVRARLDSPTLRIPGNPFILPVNVGLLPVDRHKLFDLSADPYLLPVREEIALQATVTAASEPGHGLIWVQDVRQQVPPGRIQWVRGTSTTAAVIDTWTQVAVTLDQALPSGYWCVVGSEHQSTNAIAHRFLFPGKVWRPGFLSRTAEGNMSYPWNYNGVLGELGRFVNDNPFNVQVLCHVADASHVFYFGLVQVASL